MIRDYSKVQLDEAQIAAQGYKNFLGGQAAEWERRGAFQVELLRELGLRPQMTLLDVGCGPIRAGLHFMRFLEPGRYRGVDFNPSFVQAAQQVIEAEGLADRLPRVSLLADFQFAQLEETFDFLLCFSVLNHCDAAQRRQVFAQVPAVMHARSRLVITHAAWFDPACLEGTGLVLERMISNETELPEHLAFARWGFGSVGDRLPLVELRRG